MAAALTVFVVAMPGALREAWCHDADRTIRSSCGSSEIVIKTKDRVAAAIDSMTWRGQEFVDSHDHGRQFQSAISFDGGRDEPFWAERYNPTEAGSRADGIGDRSTSRLLEISATDHSLRTRTQMAFWLAPGEESYGRLVINEQVLSDIVLEKQVTIGDGTFDNVIDYLVIFDLPASSKKHRYVQFEALTGYMPVEFSRFETWDPQRNTAEHIDDGPGEQSKPLLFSTVDGSHAIGVMAVMPAEPDLGVPGYGRFRFQTEQVVKWNCVWRKQAPDGVEPGWYRFHIKLIIGDRQEVLTTFDELHRDTLNRKP